MTHPALIERITRSLAYMLRHQPEKFDLRLDPYGWGEIGEVVRALNEKLGEAVSEDDLRDALRSGDRPRYEIQDDRVRALYGHSIDVLPGETSKPPEFLYVGVASRDADRAQRYGLRGGRRRFLHLARSVDEAREAGRRTGPEYAVLTVFALDAWEEGVNFYDRQALFLAEEIPTQFIEVHERGEDGYEAPQRENRSHSGRGGREERGERRGGGREGRGRGGRGRSRGGSRGGERGGERGGSRGDERSDERRGSDRSHEERRDSGGREQPERQREPRRESRPEERPREHTERSREPEREEPVVVLSSQRQEPPTDFGLGVFEEAATPARRKEPPKPEPVAAQPEPVPEPEPEPEPTPRDEGPTFGAGL